MGIAPTPSNLIHSLLPMHGYAMPAATSNKTDWRQLAILIFLAVIIALLWNTFVVYPLRVLVVVFHEFSHGAAALLTGGEIVEIQINHREGGHCITRGGIPFIIVSAGYIGSLLCGAAILYATSRTRSAHVLSGILGAILLLATFIWIRPLIGFGFAFATIAAVALILTSFYFPHAPNDVALKVIGLTSCLYAPLDIKSDVFDAGHAVSDATILAHQTGVPAVVWGTLWLIISLIIGFYALRAACRAINRPDHAK
ncbi:MAG TPA: M50 family metallopeptidase [Candidatus Hydrogenedentes bacterium]|nr:M50 family metallopeptidase [Candidatus Hydrogenedentota bacterium]